MLDANILIRAVLGSRALRLLLNYAGRVSFVAPVSVFDEAREHIPNILRGKGVEPDATLDVLGRLRGLVRAIDWETYADFEALARERIARRDEDDWPVLATALALECPIWTEDTDFFGCGVATWTTDRVELYLSKQSG